ncbi:transmembrane and TPR repeat-containing protein 1-like isoform X2 [Tetranychus urticae]|nr:transmembrane and TPR repeat-containing protein 1-like isoform X2 [Tetranychus urticae]
MCISRQCKYCCCVNATWIRNRKYTGSTVKPNLTCSSSRSTLTFNQLNRQQCTSKSLLNPSINLLKSGVSEVWCQLKTCLQPFFNGDETSSLLSSNSSSLKCPTQPTRRNSLIQIHGLLVLVTFLCYANSIPGDFVHDDIEAIVRNPDVIGINNWTSLWFNDFWGKPMSDPLSHKSYRPLTTLTFRLNMALRKGENDSTISWKFRLVNVILHILVVQLIMYTVNKVLNCSKQMSLLVALHFAVHPIHTEAVSSNVGRADILCSIFSLLTFILFSRAYKSMLQDKSNNKSIIFHLVLSCTTSTMALLSKETGITILPICILYYVFKLTQQGSLAITRNRICLIYCNKNLSQSIYYESKAHHSSSSTQPSLTCLCAPIIVPVIMTAALLWFRVSMLHGTLPIFSQQDNPASFSNSLLTRFLTYSYLCAFNWRLILYPSCLSYDWQMGSIPLVTKLADFRNLETVLTFAVLGAIFLILLKYTSSHLNKSESFYNQSCHKVNNLSTSNQDETNIQSKDYLYEPIFIGFCFLIVPYLPASNLLTTVGFVVAERVLYLPSLGFSLLFITGYYLIKQRLLSNHEQHYTRWLNITFYSLVIVFMMKTFTQNAHWQSRETLFSAGLLATPQNAKMHYNYANMQKDNGNNELAVHHYREALRLWPTHESSWNNLATLLADPEEAEWHLLQALRINPYHPKAHFNLACIYSKKGLINQAINLLQRSIELDSNFAEPYSTLASIYAEKGLHLDADLLHQKSLKIQPNNPDLINNYGAFLQKTGQTEKAIIQYQKALKINPNHKIANANLAQIWKSLNDTNLKY